MATVATQVRNQTILHDGYAPSNCVLGTRGLRIPGSALQDSEAERLETQNATLDPESAMAASLPRRETAKVALVRLE